MYTKTLRIILHVTIYLTLVPLINAQKSDVNQSFTMLMLQQAAQNESSESELLRELIEVEIDGLTVEEALVQIAEKANLKLMYSERLFEEDKRVYLSRTTLSLYNALWTVLDETGLKFAISENRQLIIMKAKDIESVASDIEMQETVRGVVRDAQTGEALPGVNILVQGTADVGTTTDIDGEFELLVPSLQESLVFSYIGYVSLVINIDGRTDLQIELRPDIQMLDDLVVVGYGVQRRSDITGSVASVPLERLEMAPNLNITQAIQGAVPGVMVQTTSGGAASSEVLMVRGRNSITASNDPLIVVDGISYSGNIRDINPNDVESIEVLKDASAAAIYGSRGANGVILISTKEGSSGAPQISYDGRYSTQRAANTPNMMNAEEFFDFKINRHRSVMTQRERELYEDGVSVDWIDLGLRRGNSQEHNLSVSGGFQNTTYYLSGGLLDVRGIAVNDDYMRATSRINIDTQIAEWLTIGSRSQFAFSDQSGVVPNMSEVFEGNPLSEPYDEAGNLAVLPYRDDPVRANPLQALLYDNVNDSHQIVLNNFAIVDIPFITGLSYRFNSGLTMRFRDFSEYRGRNTKSGLDAEGRSSQTRSRLDNTVIENILTYNTNIKKHSIFATAVLGYESNSFSSNVTTARGYPNDLLSWHASGQAESIVAGGSFNKTHLMSQMARLNYVYDSRYLITLTARRDGFSGFGDNNKWGFFPSVALGWNLSSEEFFPWNDLFSELKFRVSYGIGGNQAVGAYESISRLREENWVSQNNTVPGFLPSRLGQEDLGWESSKTFNFGLDFGLLEDRITGDINLYHTNTHDLLLQRSISSVHGITSVIQNIGETRNRGIEFSLRSRNINTRDFSWVTAGNIAFTKNEIVDLYGDGLDDVANGWFIGQPIRVNYGYVWDGVFQLGDTEEAEYWGSQPGFVRVKDVNGDGDITAEDRQIQGQQDPSIIWGISNSFSYKDLSLDIFMHALHGLYKRNDIKRDRTPASVPGNTTMKNRWTPDNPSNEVMNHPDAREMAGVEPWIYDDASFIRIKDITLSYSLPQSLISDTGINRVQMYVNGRNLFTLTGWSGLDPELNGHLFIPLQKEIVFGVNIGF